LGNQASKAFEEMKALIATDTVLSHPDHNKGLKIYTNATIGSVQ
jgi:hypothetical protein